MIKTARGTIKTPFFMPDATAGFVKLTDNQSLNRAGVKALVVNALHLYLRPGLKIINQANGLHDFMGWTGPLLADSGGFQIFSLIRQKRLSSPLGRVDDKGVTFKSPWDGSKHVLTPEKSIQIQFELGVEMMVCLDDCPPNDSDLVDLEKSVARTIAWAQKSRTEYDRQVKKRKIRPADRPRLFAVIQGGMEPDLRARCAVQLVKIGFDGYGFGARPVDGEGKFLENILRLTADLIPPDALRFALGVGLPEDIVRCVLSGWDMFDCVIPTREGRHGKLFVFREKTKMVSPLKNYKNLYQDININNAEFAQDFSPLNQDSKLPELREATKAYLHYLFKFKEPLAQRLASLNNLEFYSNLTEKIRLELRP